MALQPLIWLAQPTRFAALSRGRARLALVALLLLLAGAMTALVPPSRGVDERTVDRIVLEQGIVDGMRHGGSYYVVAADTLRDGSDPMPAATALRLPVLASIQAALPRWGVVALLYALAATVLIAWFARLRSVFARRAPLLLAIVLLAGGMASIASGALVAVPELWAGLLIAVSLALRRPGRWIAAAGVGALAMLIRESAALFVIVMALTAWIEGDRREALGWVGGIALLAIALFAHAEAVAAIRSPLDGGTAAAAGLPGFGAFVAAVTQATVLRPAPMWLGAPLIALALFGWAAWRDATGLRVLATVTLHALAIALFAGADSFYWGLMVAPMLLLGLAFAPDALRDAVGAAVARRHRITVTRLT